MQEPFAGFAVDPRLGLVRQACDEVVAARFVAIPPARLDALGPCKQDEFTFIQFLRFEQPQRARPRWTELVRVPFTRLDAPPGMLGAMVGMRGEAADGRVPQARAQPLEQARPVFG